ncbi:zinc ribbon domain-containing protein [Pseudorhodobacter sp. E13]|uniref:zinc ribbon domain-containing protein n=1 Tax=Pseudorhodobacter sp. E13 TaxID=2487931 RepID=UPI000F8E9F84|nr:zinc ribbon domain-containing protein [Pseudorhodobacter sp. E13]RUS60910.1 zinc ribbon domain-containing protein [Pseudorhodobacter sp. E13]
MTDDQTHRWPCDSCGADLRFAPGQTELVCDHCGNVQAIPKAMRVETSRAMGEHDLARGLRDDLPQAAMETPQTTPCPNCGALVEFSGAEHAAQCPFCATPVVIGTGTNRQIKPQALVPFQLDERSARAAMAKWLGRLWFAPNGLVEYARKGRALSGLYVPHWTFDAATRSAYSGQRGTYYYETRTVMVEVNGKRQQRQEQVRKTRWQSVSGRVARAFDDVLVLASQSLPRHYTEGLQPWDMTGLTPYRPDYLAGFIAEGYTVSLADGNALAHQKMAQVIAQDVARDIGGDEQRISHIDTDYSAETFKHILLPIWMAAYKYNGKTYRFVVNGQTGKVQGERPYSAWKIAFAVLAAAIVIGAVVYFNQ